MAQPKLEIKGISKSFPGVKALVGVDFDLLNGEIHSLVGENGAGKSTLINIITGQLKPDEGEIVLDGEKVIFDGPDEAAVKGIGLVPQELNLIPLLSVSENIFLGVKKRKTTFPFDIDWKSIYSESEKILDSLGVKLDVKAPVGTMSVANQQLVQIARAIVLGADLLIFDEPTACLTLNESDQLLDLIKQFRNEGRAIIYVSHHMDEIMKISDRTSIMRDGKMIETLNRDEFSMQRIIKGMVGKEIVQNQILRKEVGSETILKVDHLSHKNEFCDISFEIMKGEIFGIAGLVGAGRTELVSCIFGQSKFDSGEIYLNGQSVKISNPKNAINLGIGYLPEERRQQGILPTLSIRENLTIASISNLFRFPRIDTKLENEIVEDYVQKLRIKLANKDDLLTKLSGGNQQKVILSRWLAVGSKLLILDEPTRGIDILAKDEIYHLMRECADNGLSILMVSSEMEELINLCSRILIMHEGRSKGIVNASEMNPERLLNIALS
jgi:ABC-type sugar transport system ATPase subunit